MFETSTTLECTKEVPEHVRASTSLLEAFTDAIVASSGVSNIISVRELIEEQGKSTLDELFTVEGLDKVDAMDFGDTEIKEWLVRDIYFRMCIIMEIDVGIGNDLNGSLDSVIGVFSTTKEVGHYCQDFTDSVDLKGKPTAINIVILTRYEYLFAYLVRYLGSEVIIANLKYKLSHLAE